MAQKTVICGRHYRLGQVCEVTIENGMITKIDDAPRRVPGTPAVETYIAPGLIDLQVNGWRGVDFTSGDLTPERVWQALVEMREAGVTACLPTVTTNDRQVILHSLRVIAQAHELYPAARWAILGIHLEGPYISAEDGPRGAHPRQHVRPPDWDEFCQFQEAARGLIRYVTLAPELPGALEMIVRLRQQGVLVGLGHHAASREQIQAAVEAGAQLATHLGNGCHASLPRHNNYLWEQLADDRLQASVIADGHHLPAAVLKSFYRVKGAGRLILVSDAIHLAGLPAGEYGAMGSRVEVQEDGFVRLKGTPYLAGSTLRLWQTIPRMMAGAGASLAEAIEMASANPARLLGVYPQRGALQVGSRANLTLFRFENGQFGFEQVMVGGVK